jgi:hypothetical protein
MNKVTKIGLIILLSLLAFLTISTISEKSKMIGTIVEYPQKEHMNSSEEKIFDGLFTGDTMVRVRLAETGEIVSAICPAEKIAPIGTIVWVSKFLNGKTYLVKQVAK